MEKTRNLHVLNIKAEASSRSMQQSQKNEKIIVSMLQARFNSHIEFSLSANLEFSSKQKSVSG